MNRQIARLKRYDWSRIPEKNVRYIAFIKKNWYCILWADARITFARIQF